MAEAAADTMTESLRTLLPSLPSPIVCDLLSLGVCTRCVLRFLNVRSIDFAATLPSPSNFLSHLNTPTPPSSETNGSGQTTTVMMDCEPGIGTDKSNVLGHGGTKEPCIVCLDVLYNKADNGAPTQIVEAARKEGQVFSTFCLEVSVPAIALVRERSLWYYLKQKYPEEALFSHNYETNHIVSLKEAVKWSLIAPLEAQLSAKFDSNASFRIALLYKHSASRTELEFLSQIGGDAKRRRQGLADTGPTAGLAAIAAARTAEAGDSVATVMRALSSMTFSTFARHFPSPPSKLLTRCELTTMCWRMPVFVGGRYLKYSRNISQSRWMIDDERMGEGSVQEVIGNVVFPYYKGDSYKFHAAGREDIDVRMLGPGRPFIIEISNARNIPALPDMAKLEAEINGLKEGWENERGELVIMSTDGVIWMRPEQVKVRELRQVGIEACAIMREGESEKQKEYAAVVWLSRSVIPSDFENLSSLKEMELQQKTPVRVLHRRSPLIRPRTIHWMRCEEIKGSENYFLLFLCTQAGTYVKEFVHGDLGRTYPNVGSILGCEADILQLDVMDVKMDFL